MRLVVWLFVNPRGIARSPSRLILIDSRDYFQDTCMYYEHVFMYKYTVSDNTWTERHP